MPASDNINNEPDSSLTDYEKQQLAAELHHSVVKEKENQKVSWFRMGRKLVKLKETGLWKSLVSKNDGWLDYLSSRDVSVSAPQYSRLSRWIKAADQLGLGEQAHIGISEGKITRHLVPAIKYSQEDEETILNKDAIKGLFYKSRECSWNEFIELCRQERDRRDPKAIRKKDHRYKRFKEGKVYDGHGFVIGAIEGVSGHGKHQYLRIKIENSEIPKRANMAIVIPEDLIKPPQDKERRNVDLEHRRRHTDY